jgi:hypothetical protein
MSMKTLRSQIRQLQRVGIAHVEDVELHVAVFQKQVRQQRGVGVVDDVSVAFLQAGVDLEGQPAFVGQLQQVVHQMILQDERRFRAIAPGRGVPIREQVVERALGVGFWSFLEPERPLIGHARFERDGALLADAVELQAEGFSPVGECMDLHAERLGLGVDFAPVPRRDHAVKAVYRSEVAPVAVQIAVQDR